MKSIFTILIIAVALLSVILSGCLSVPGPSIPAISFSPSNPVAGQSVRVIVQSSDLYSNFDCSLSVDGQPITLYGTNDIFWGNWIAQNGSHTFTATVTDSYNHSAFISKTINVCLPNPPSIYNISISPANSNGGQILTLTFSSTSVIGIQSISALLDSQPLSITQMSNTYISTFTAIPGNHIIKITSTDTMGTSSSTSVSFQVANYPYPVIKSISWSPQYPTINTPSVIFKITGYDPLGFTSSVYIDNMPVQTTTISSQTSVATWMVVPGNHTVNVVLTDPAGWYNEKTYHIAVTPQAQNMFIVLGISPQQISQNGTATISAVVYNYYPPMQRIWLYMDNTLVYTVSATDTLKYTFMPPIGIHRMMVIAQDGVGMEASAVSTLNVTYNPSIYPPQINVAFTPQATIGVAKILTLRAIATAPGAVISNVTFEDMISNTQIGNTTVGNNGLYAISWIPDETGNVPILIRVTDSNGIQSATIVNVKVSPNYVNGNSPLIYPIFNSTIEQSSMVTFAASVVSHAQIREIDMWIDGVPITPSKSATGLYWIKWIASATGTHLFKVYAQDIYGGAATADFYFYVYPGALPQMLAYATPVSVYVGGNITLGATVLKSESAINYVNFYVDNVEIGSSYYPPYKITWKAQSAGSHTLTVEAVNIYGQKGYASTYFNIFKDTIPPTLQLSVQSTASTGQTVPITVNASDSISGINYIQIQIYSSSAPQPYPGIVPIILKNFSSPNFTFDWIPTQVATYTIYAIAYDNADNSTKNSAMLDVK